MPADVASVLAGLPPPKRGKNEWLAAARRMAAEGRRDEAGLMLATLCQAHDGDARLRVLAAALAMRSGRWTEALAEARCAR